MSAQGKTRTLINRIWEEANSPRWAAACHLTSFSAFFGVPFGHFIGPLAVWILRKKKDPLVNQQGKEAMNFQLSMTTYAVLIALLAPPEISAPAMIAVAVTDFLFVLVAGIKTARGGAFRYPLAIRVFR